VRLHSTPRHFELAGDLGIVTALQEQFDDLLFPRPEPNGQLPPTPLGLHYVSDRNEVSLSNSHSTHNAILRRRLAVTCEQHFPQALTSRDDGFWESEKPSEKPWCQKFSGRKRKNTQRNVAKIITKHHRGIAPFMLRPRAIRRCRLPGKIKRSPWLPWREAERHSTRVNTLDETSRYTRPSRHKLHDPTEPFRYTRLCSTLKSNLAKGFAQIRQGDTAPKIVLLCYFGLVFATLPKGSRSR
jgi:hypothetical protein